MLKLIDPASLPMTKEEEFYRDQIAQLRENLGSFGDVARQAIQLKNEEHIKSIAEIGKKMTAVLTDMLNFVDSESSKKPCRDKAFDLKEIIYNNIELHTIMIYKKGLQVLVNYDENITPRLSGDCYKIHRIVLNLFANAIKFTHTGTVTVTARVATSLPETKAEIEFTIEDTGIGIPADKQVAIFERFNHISAPDGDNSAHAASNLGGLWIVKQFIDAMGGKISVVSKVGKGSKFTCLFPCSVALGVAYDKKEKN